jgi:nitroreductase
MVAHMPLDGIVNDSYSDVMFKREAIRSLDPNFKVSHEEIMKIIAEGCTAPSALDSQPWKFIVAESDEAKQHLDNLMHPPFDNGRIVASSFGIVVCADKNWIEDYDKIVDRNVIEAPALYTPEMAGIIKKGAVDWYTELTEDGDALLERSVCFQAGLVAMQLMLAVRAHGLESGPMDAFDKWDIAEYFGVDTDRYLPLLVLAVGKPAADGIPVCRLEPEKVTVCK